MVIGLWSWLLSIFLSIFAILTFLCFHLCVLIFSSLVVSRVQQMPGKITGMRKVM